MLALLVTLAIRVAAWRWLAPPRRTLLRPSRSVMSPRALLEQGSSWSALYAAPGPGPGRSPITIQGMSVWPVGSLALLKTGRQEPNEAFILGNLLSMLQVALHRAGSGPQGWRRTGRGRSTQHPVHLTRSPGWGHIMGLALLTAPLPLHQPSQGRNVQKINVWGSPKRLPLGCGALRFGFLFLHCNHTSVRTRPLGWSHGPH